MVKVFFIYLTILIIYSAQCEPVTRLVCSSVCYTSRKIGEKTFALVKKLLSFVVTHFFFRNYVHIPIGFFLDNILHISIDI